MDRETIPMALPAPKPTPTWMYLDDLREAPSSLWTVVRSVEAARALIEAQGLPSAISFDHDLGDNSPGGDAPELARWLVERHLDGDLDLSQCLITVHSANPAGAARLRGMFERLPASGAGRGLDPWTALLEGGEL